MKPFISTQPDIIQNAIRVIADDVYLKSTHQHDHVEHNGYAADGGLAYLRRGFIKREGFEEWSLHDNSPFSEICRKLLWGTRGPDGKAPLAYRPISTLQLDHLRAIRDTQLQLKGSLHEKVVLHWIAKHEADNVAAVPTIAAFKKGGKKPLPFHKSLRPRKSPRKVAPKK